MDGLGVLDNENDLEMKTQTLKS